MATYSKAAKKDDPDSQRQRATREAWEAYAGNFPRPLKVTRTGQDDNIIVNRCRPVVDKGVSFLFGSSLVWEYPKSVKKKLSGFVDSTWAAMRQDTFLKKLATNAGITGMAVIKLVPSLPYPRFVIWDAANLTVTTAPDDCDSVTSYAYAYNGTDPQGQAIQKRQLISQTGDTEWTIADQVLEGEQWNQVGAAITWPYPFSPVITAQNLPVPNSFWGQSDIPSDLIQMNKDLNFMLSLMSRIVRFHAFPKTVGKGFNADSLRVAADGTIMLPSPDSSLEILELTSDLSSVLNMIAQINDRMDELARVPGIALGNMRDMPKGNVSGIALKVLYAPLLEKTATKQGLYGDLVIELNRRLMVMAGGDPEDVILHWPNPLPVNELEDVQVAQAYSSLGVSKHTIFTRLGLDYDQETENKEDEKADNPPPPQLAAVAPEAPPDGSQQGQAANPAQGQPPASGNEGKPPAKAA